MTVLGLLQLFEEDESSNALTVRWNVTNLLAVLQLSNYAIDGFVRAFLRKTGSTPIKHLHELLANCLILSPGVVRVGIEAREKPI